MSCCTDQAPLRMTMIKDAKIEDRLTPVAKLKCQGNCERCEKKKTDKKVMLAGKLLLVLATLSGLPALAQTAAPQTFMDDPINDPMMPLYVVTTLVFITVVLVLVVTVYMLRIFMTLTRQLHQERAVKEGYVYTPQVSWWTKTWDKLNAAVPVAEEKDIDLGHNFDGIRELDNHLPPWWKWLFYATIVWGILYMIVYHIAGSLPLSREEYKNELTQAEEKARIFNASQPTALIDENTLTLTNDEVILGKGKIIFLSNCVPCHRNDGGGNTIGPNLTDVYWLHGGELKNVFTTIKNGVVEKGMPAWGKAMSPQDVRDVAFYVMTLQGTNPVGGKAPQGDLFVAVKKEKEDSLLIKNDSLIVKR